MTKRGDRARHSPASWLFAKPALLDSLNACPASSTTTGVVGDVGVIEGVGFIWRCALHGRRADMRAGIGYRCDASTGLASAGAQCDLAAANAHRAFAAQRHPFPTIHELIIASR